MFSIFLGVQKENIELPLMKAKEIGQPLFTFKCFFPWLLDIEGKRREILEENFVTLALFIIIFSP